MIDPNKPQAMSLVFLPSCPVLGCLLPVDGVIDTSDGERLGCHLSNLSTFSDGLTGIVSGYIDGTRLIAVPAAQKKESSEITKLLLAYTHREIPPDLREYTFAKVYAFANAAHEYGVHHAIRECQLLMERFLDRDIEPLEILTFSFRYPDGILQNAASKKLLNMASSVLYHATLSNEQLPKFIAWDLQRESLRQKVLSVLRTPPAVAHKGGVTRCNQWKKSFIILAFELLKDTSCVYNLERMKELVNEFSVRLEECRWCQITAKIWKTKVSNIQPDDLEINEGMRVDEAAAAARAILSKDNLISILSRPPKLIHKGNIKDCEYWHLFYEESLAREWLSNGYPTNLDDFNKAIRRYEVRLAGCSYCLQAINTWRERFSIASEGFSMPEY